MRFTITENTDQNHMTAAAFKRAVKIAGLTMPDFDPATVPTADWTPASTEEIADAAFKVAAAGKDPAADKNVQALLTSRLLANTIGGLYHRNQVALSKAELEHYQEHAPALLEDLTTAFDDAVEAMTDAAQIIGHMDLEDGLRQSGNMRPERAQAVAHAHVANGRARNLIDALPVIAAATGETLDAGPHHGLLTYSKPSLHQFKQHNLNSQSTRNNYGRAHNVWDLLNDGVSPELATTAEELAARRRRIEREADDLNIDHRAEAAQHAEARAQAKAMGF
jgi:hypothetical protein